MPTELWFVLALVGWVAVLLPISAAVDRLRERRLLREATERAGQGRPLSEGDVATMVANERWEDVGS